MSQPTPPTTQPLETNTQENTRDSQSAAGPPSAALASATGAPDCEALDSVSKCACDGECNGERGSGSECITSQTESILAQTTLVESTLDQYGLNPGSTDTKSHSQPVDSQPPIDTESQYLAGGEGVQVGVGGLVGIHSPSQPKIVPKEISESKLGNKRSGKLEKKNNVLYIARKKREYWAKLMKEDEGAAEAYKGANGWAWAVRDGSKDRRPVEGVVGGASPKVTYASGDGGGGSLSTYEEGNGGSYVSEGKLAEIVAGAVAKAVAEALAGVKVKDSGKLVEEKIIRWTGRKENVVWNEGEEEVEVVGAPRNQFMRMVKKGGDGSIGEMWCRGKLDKMVGWRVGVTVIDGKMNLAGRYGRNGGRVG